MMENTNKLTILTLFVTLLFVGCKKKGGKNGACPPTLTGEKGQKIG